MAAGEARANWADRRLDGGDSNTLQAAAHAWVTLKTACRPPDRWKVRRAHASIVLFLLLGCGLIAGCGDTAAGGADQHFLVSERDFHIDAPAEVNAGPTELTVDNNGPDDHELIVVRGRRASLPVRADGLTIDEDAIEHREAGALEPATPGAKRDVEVDLRPGHYVMFCNMYGHFMAGMHTDLVVR